MQTARLADDHLANAFSEIASIGRQIAPDEGAPPTMDVDLSHLGLDSNRIDYNALGIAAELVKAEMPALLPGYNAQRLLLSKQKKVLTLVIVGLGVMAVGLAARSVWAGIRYLHADGKLWKSVFNILPNGEVEMTWQMVRIGNTWHLMYAPVMIKIPRELATADRLYYEAIQALNGPLFWKVGGLAILSGVATIPVAVVLARIPKAGDGFGGIRTRSFSDTIQRHQQPQLSQRLLRAGVLSERVTAQFLRLEQLQNVLEQRGGLAHNQSVCLDRLYNLARERDGQALAVSRGSVWSLRRGTDEQRIAEVYRICLEPLLAA